MAVHYVDDAEASSLEILVDDYLAHCQARGLSHRTLSNTYGYSLKGIFLPWCRTQGITQVGELTSRVLDRFTSSLLQRVRPNGSPISKHTVATYVRPVRLFLTWARSVGRYPARGNDDRHLVPRVCPAC